MLGTHEAGNRSETLQLHARPSGAAHLVRRCLEDVPCFARSPCLGVRAVTFVVEKLRRVRPVAQPRLQRDDLSCRKVTVMGGWTPVGLQGCDSVRAECGVCLTRHSHTTRAIHAQARHPFPAVTWPFIDTHSRVTPNFALRARHPTRPARTLQRPRTPMSALRRRPLSSGQGAAPARPVLRPSRLLEPPPPSFRTSYATPTPSELSTNPLTRPAQPSPTPSSPRV